MKQKLNQLAGNLQSINQRKIKNAFKSGPNQGKTVNESADDEELAANSNPDAFVKSANVAEQQISNSNSKY